jgi:hypothetical protein
MASQMDQEVALDEGSSAGATQVGDNPIRAIALSTEK